MTARNILLFQAVVFVLLLSVGCAGVRAATSKTSLSVAPASLSFGSESVNITTTQSLTLSNTGRTPLQIQSITLNGSTAFQLTNWTDKQTVQPGANIVVNVSFTPTAATTYSATLAVSTNANDATVAVSGTGTGTTTGTSIGVSVSPTAATVQVGMTQQFMASVSGTTDTGVTWLVNGVKGGNSTAGTITSGGLYTAPAAVPTGTVTVSAVSNADTSKSSSAAVTVMAAPAPVSVAISPTSATLQVGTTQQFMATVSGTTNSGVSWLVNSVQGGNSTVGTISSSGLYTAPGAVPSGSTVTVTADSNADTTKSANAAVDVTAAPSPVSVAVSPTSATVAGGASQQFTATVTGTTNTGVTWSVNGIQAGNSTYGTISSTGLYTAPACPSLSSVTVTATSLYDSTASGNASATLSGTASSSGTYYVATTGSDSSDGSACHPWATFAHADSVVGPGATVHVAAGTYSEAPSLSKSGTSSARIRWISDSKWGAHIDPVVCSTCAVVTFNGSYLDFMGFDVGGGYGYIGILDWGSYNHTLGNKVHDIPATGCTSAGGAGIATASWTGTGAQIVGNFVYNIATPAGSCNKVPGIYHENSNGYIANNLVGNIATYGLECAHYCQSSMFVNNTVFHSGGGLWVGDTDNGQLTSNIYAANNILYDIVPGVNFTACAIREYSGTTGPGNQYVDNLIYKAQCSTQLSTGTITGTVSVDPLFVNYQTDGSGDYHLQSSSPASNAGTSTNAPATDFSGGSRPVGPSWDIGAYEYGAPAKTWPWY